MPEIMGSEGEGKMRRLMILLLCVVCVGGLTACRGQMDADAESVSETQRTDMKDRKSTRLNSSHNA